MSAFEKNSLPPLSRPHRAATAKLSLPDAVHEVRGTDEEVQVEGPVLAVLEGSEAIEYQRFVGGLFRTKLFVEEQTVSAQAFGLELQGAVRDAELTADLAQTGATDEAMEEGFQEVGVAEPIGGGEGL